MQQSAVAIRNQLLQIAASVWGETALHQPIVTTDLLHQESYVRPNLDRVQLGLILRHVTEAYFESALTLAIASIALEALHNYFTDVARKAEDSQAVGGAQWVSERATELLMRQVSASNIRKSVIEQAVLREGNEEEVAAWTHILSRCEKLREILMGTICDMQLQGELQRPSLPLSGHDIKKVGQPIYACFCNDYASVYSASQPQACIIHTLYCNSCEIMFAIFCLIDSDLQETPRQSVYECNAATSNTLLE